MEGGGWLEEPLSNAGASDILDRMWIAKFILLDGIMGERPISKISVPESDHAWLWRALPSINMKNK